MGKIFRRGIDFSGGGGSISNPTAASVTFDNTDTGLNATNVQDAVTEVNGNLDKMITTKYCTITTVANNYRTIDKSSISSGSIPMDDKAIPVVVGVSNTSKCTITIHFNSTNWRIYSDVAQDVTIIWYVIICHLSN